MREEFAPEGQESDKYIKDLDIVSSQRPGVLTNEECINVWLDFIGGKTLFQIAQARKIAVGTVAKAIRFARFKIGELPNPFFYQQVIVEHHRTLIVGLTDQLNESKRVLSSINEALKTLEEEGLLILEESDLKKWKTLLSLRQTELSTVTRVIGEIRNTSGQLADLTGAKKAASMIRSKNPKQNLTKKLEDMNDEDLDKLIESHLKEEERQGLI